MYPCSIPYHGQALNITVENYRETVDVGLIAWRALARSAQIADALANRIITNGTSRPAGATA
jgi:hypothetical protein